MLLYKDLGYRLYMSYAQGSSHRTLTPKRAGGSTINKTKQN